MVGNWASDTDINDDVIETLQADLTVDMIMTPRERLSCCKPTDSAEEIVSNNANEYSAFPVIDKHNHIVGIFRTDERTEISRDTEITVCSKMQILSEGLLIGAKDRILDYVMNSVNRPIQLVVSDRKIVGLVTPSDLQQIPVRVMLFSLITSLEIAMARLIDVKYPRGYICWHKFLSPGRKMKVNDAIQESKNKDLFVRDVLYTQVADKREILAKGNLLGRTSTNLGNHFKPIIALRDNLSHANDYANTEEAAHKLPDTIKSIIDIQKEILKAAKEISSQS